MIESQETLKLSVSFEMGLSPPSPPEASQMEDHLQDKISTRLGLDLGIGIDREKDPWVLNVVVDTGETRISANGDLIGDIVHALKNRMASYSLEYGRTRVEIVAPIGTSPQIDT